LASEVGGLPIQLRATGVELLEVSGKTHGYDPFTPASGSEFLTVTIASCAVAGEYPVEGSIAGEGEAWGTEQVEQPLNFSSAIDGVTGPSLTFAEEVVSLTGTAKNKLTRGLKFGAL
jgi:hypothetical protein